ncbi:hypothetical protein NON00_23240 [Roseomonas sp. GC11]|uniref:hypothetical protein n=1 Tax=Roseomonas sp. GC11 TaxID=2950546 RepID=UPI00210E919D|nr:hypothetical protein [Roseomonas sp. GC11]MCQ4162822.1 hypothetical protein [Roseomonas sp. GC11]
MSTSAPPGSPSGPLPAALLAPLLAAARAGGTVRAIAGNTPLLLAEPGRTLLVLEGMVELFLVPLEESRVAGARQHLCSLPAGALLLAPEAAAEGVGLLAAGHVGSRVAELDRALLEGWAAQAALRPALAAALEAWVEGLGGAMVRPAGPPAKAHARQGPAARRAG